MRAERKMSNLSYQFPDLDLSRVSLLPPFFVVGSCERPTCYCCVYSRQWLREVINFIEGVIPSIDPDPIELQEQVLFVTGDLSTQNVY